MIVNLIRVLILQSLILNVSVGLSMMLWTSILNIKCLDLLSSHSGNQVLCNSNNWEEVSRLLKHMIDAWHEHYLIVTPFNNIDWCLYQGREVEQCKVKNWDNEYLQSCTSLMQAYCLQGETDGELSVLIPWQLTTKKIMPDSYLHTYHFAPQICRLGKIFRSIECTRFKIKAISQIKWHTKQPDRRSVQGPICW